MRKLFISVAFIAVLILLLAAGCARKIEAPPQSAVQGPAPAPPMTQVNPGTAEQPAAPAAEEPAKRTIGNRVEGAEEAEATPGTQNAPYTEGKGDVSSIGTRVEGTEVASLNESIREGGIEIMLNPDKTMNVSAMTIPVGTTLFWKNYDTWPHVIAVDSGSGFDTVRHDKSGQLQNGMVWSYTFREKGTFLARDLFSGKMRMTVTVE